MKKVLYIGEDWTRCIEICCDEAAELYLEIRDYKTDIVLSEIPSTSSRFYELQTMLAINFITLYNSDIYEIVY